MNSTNAERTTSRGIPIFIGTAYALSVALSLLIGLTGGHESALIALSYLSMFLPAIAVLFVTKAMNEAPRVRWNSFPMRFLPVALFLMPGVLHAVMLPLMGRIDGGVQWQDWLTPEADGLYHAPASRGWGALTIQRDVAASEAKRLSTLVRVARMRRLPGRQSPAEGVPNG